MTERRTAAAVEQHISWVALGSSRKQTLEHRHSQLRGWPPWSGGVKPSRQVVGVNQGLGYAHRREALGIGNAVDVVRTIVTASGEDRATEQFAVSWDRIEHPGDRGSIFWGKFGGQVVPIRWPVDQLQRVEVELVSDVQRRVTATPLQIGGLGAVPVVSRMRA